MIVSAEKHVFGHQGQYRTLLASDKLRPEEVAELEQFQFGQTNDHAYLNSLARNPALILRPLKTGRFALTRVSKGPDDAAGRNTLLFTTLVVPASAWVRSLAANILEILISPGSTWDTTTPTVSLASPDPYPFDKGYSTETADWVTAQLKSLTGTGTSLWAFSDIVNIRVLGHILAKLPPASLERFSFAYRSLSDGISVALNSLERQYVRSGTGRIGVWFLGNELSATQAAVRPNLTPSPRTEGAAAPSGASPKPVVEQEDTMPFNHERGSHSRLALATLVALILSQGIMGWMLIRQDRKLDKLAQSRTQSSPGSSIDLLPGRMDTVDKDIKAGYAEAKKRYQELFDEGKLQAESMKSQVQEGVTGLAKQIDESSNEITAPMDKLVKGMDTLRQDVASIGQRLATLDSPEGRLQKLESKVDEVVDMVTVPEPGAKPKRLSLLKQVKELLTDKGANRLKAIEDALEELRPNRRR